MAKEKEDCCMRTKKRSEEEYKEVAAANSALNSFTRVLLENHMRSCVAEDIREGRDDKLEEVLKTLQKLMK